MEWITTSDSSAIEGFGYDAARRTLEVAFKQGRTYTYFNVPPRVFTDMQAAESKGHFVTDHVKGVYQFQDKRDLVRPRVRVRPPRH